MSKQRRVPLVTVAYLGGLAAVAEEFLWSLARLVQHSAESLDFKIELERTKISYHSAARNELARKFRGQWLLQLDTDHEFEPDLLARLLNTALSTETPVVSGLYQYKTPPFQPNAFMWSKIPGRAEPIGWWEPTQPVFRVDATGGGVLLVHRSVFNRIRSELKEEPFDILPPWGEDFSFYQRLSRLGIPAVLDTRIKSYHLRTAHVDLDDYERCKDACTFNDERTTQAA